MQANLIERILSAARRPMPQIVESFQLLGTDGKWYSGLGFPRGVDSAGERRSIGFVFRDSKSGCTFGIGAKSREELEQRHNSSQDKQAEQFRDLLVAMAPDEFASQVSYWLKASIAELAGESLVWHRSI